MGGTVYYNAKTILNNNGRKKNFRAHVPDWKKKNSLWYIFYSPSLFIFVFYLRGLWIQLPSNIPTVPRKALYIQYLSIPLYTISWCELFSRDDRYKIESLLTASHFEKPLISKTKHLCSPFSPHQPLSTIYTYMVLFDPLTNWIIWGLWGMTPKYLTAPSRLNSSVR